MLCLGSIKLVVQKVLFHSLKSGAAEDTNIIGGGFPPALRNIYLDFSYLYINKVDLAEKLLLQVLEQYKEDKRGWVVQEKEMINSMLALC